MKKCYHASNYTISTVAQPLRTPRRPAAPLHTQNMSGLRNPTPSPRIPHTHVFTALSHAPTTPNFPWKTQSTTFHSIPPCAVCEIRVPQRRIMRVSVGTKSWDWSNTAAVAAQLCVENIVESPGWPMARDAQQNSQVPNSISAQSTASLQNFQHTAKRSWSGCDVEGIIIRI